MRGLVEGRDGMGCMVGGGVGLGGSRCVGLRWGYVVADRWGRGGMC